MTPGIIWSLILKTNKQTNKKTTEEYVCGINNTSIKNFHGGKKFLSKQCVGCTGVEFCSKLENYWSDHVKVGKEIYERMYILYEGFQKLCHVKFPLW